MIETRERQLEGLFPPGTAVRVRHAIRTPTATGLQVERETLGVVEEWGIRPTGSWYAHGKDDKLWLLRLKLRKVDGELTELVMDDDTSIARLEPVNEN